MGKLINKFFIEFKRNIKVTNIQRLTVEIIDKFLCEMDVDNIHFYSVLGVGERGLYENMDNLQIEISFTYHKTFDMKFFLFYDQLEYQIFKESKIVGKCNLEDYTSDEKKMIFTFITYFKKDIIRLNLPYNNVDVLAR